MMNCFQVLLSISTCAATHWRCLTRRAAVAAVGAVARVIRGVTRRRLWGGRGCLGCLVPAAEGERTIASHWCEAVHYGQQAAEGERTMDHV